MQFKKNIVLKIEKFQNVGKMNINIYYMNFILFLNYCTYIYAFLY